MTADEQTPTPRPTPTQAYRELAMAYATKQPRAGSESVEVGQAATGAMSGLFHVKSAVFVRGDDEDWPQFIGRIEQTTGQIAEGLTRTNAAKIKRDLEAATQ